MKKTQATIFFSILAVLIVGAIFTFMTRGSSVSKGKYTAFATCIKDSGATFYGAFWCTHCNAQKKLFGDAAGLLPYVECSSPDGSEQLQICKDKNIEGYPTWVFADGSRQSGEVPLATLAEKTSCSLPQ